MSSTGSMTSLPASNVVVDDAVVAGIAGEALVVVVDEFGLDDLVVSIATPVIGHGRQCRSSSPRVCLAQPESSAVAASSIRVSWQVGAERSPSSVTFARFGCGGGEALAQQQQLVDQDDEVGQDGCRWQPSTTSGRGCSTSSVPWRSMCGRLKFRVGPIVFVAFSLDEQTMGFGFPSSNGRRWWTAIPRFMLPRPSDMRFNWVECVLADLDRMEAASSSSTPGGWSCPRSCNAPGTSVTPPARRRNACRVNQGERSFTTTSTAARADRWAAPGHLGWQHSLVLDGSQGDKPVDTSRRRHRCMPTVRARALRSAGEQRRSIEHIVDDSHGIGGGASSQSGHLCSPDPRRIDPAPDRSPGQRLRRRRAAGRTPGRGRPDQRRSRRRRPVTPSARSQVSAGGNGRSRRRASGGTARSVGCQPRVGVRDHVAQQPGDPGPGIRPSLHRSASRNSVIPGTSSTGARPSSAR